MAGIKTSKSLVSVIYESIVNFIYIVYQVLLFNRRDSEVDENNMKVNIRVGPSLSFIVDVKKHDDVARLRELFSKKLKNDDICNYKIIFAGKELHDSEKLEEYDIGQFSVLHAVKSKKKKESISGKTRSLSEFLYPDKDVQSDRKGKKFCFYVYCSDCKGICPGKLRVNCSTCKHGTLIVHRDPNGWEDVLERNRISGICQSPDCNGNIAEFYFKCASESHDLSSNMNAAVVLYLLRNNIYDVNCLICMDVRPVIITFPCPSTHIACIDCFQEYCKIRITERNFIQDPVLGYTLPCPAGCEDSLIKEIHHFKVLDDELYERYQRFAAEECLLQAGGVLCPQPNCGAGILPDENCRKVVCVQQGSEGCGFVFCRSCFQGFHLGECSDNSAEASNSSFSQYTFDDDAKNSAKWDKASQNTIKLTTKPCPNCRTPTERNEGCMHMICTKSGCGFHWCWLCQTEWSRDCMGNHWFG